MYRVHLSYFIFLGGNALMGLLDIAMGAFIVSILALLWGVDVSLGGLLLGAWLAVLPDHDIVWPLLWGHIPGYDHRQTVFHRPLLVIPLVVSATGLIGGPFWALVSLVCLVWHYLHDTDWYKPYSGITWFWPLSEAYWSWWGSYTNQPGAPHDVRPWLTPTPATTWTVLASLGLLTGSFYLSDIPIGVAVGVIVFLTVSIALLWYLHYRFGQYSKQ